MEREYNCKGLGWVGHLDSDPDQMSHPPARHMAPAAAAAVTALNDDLLREVLLLLPSPSDLLRASLSCKPFLRAARNAAFLRRFRRRHHSSCPLLLGCLLHLPLPDQPAPFLLPSAASASSARVADDADFSLSFLPRGGWSPASWQFLDCRNGFLLVKNRGSQDLAVADPFSRHCISLPAPPGEPPVGYGLVADDGDSTAFRVVCISQDGGGGGASSPGTRALVLSSGDLSWGVVAGLSPRRNLAGARAMQANGSLYWALEGGESIVALSMATMVLTVLELPPPLRQLSFDVVERGKGKEEEEEDGNVLYLLTMRGFCVEVWAGAAEEDGAGGLAWTRVEKSVRFHKVMAMMRPSMDLVLYQHGPDVIGVVAGVVFLRQWDCLLSIDLETMKLRKLSEEDCSAAQIYPCTIPWPPSFLNPTQHDA